jgi:hypothetical protein
MGMSNHTQGRKIDLASEMVCVEPSIRSHEVVIKLNIGQFECQILHSMEPIPVVRVYWIGIVYYRLMLKSAQIPDQTNLHRVSFRQSIITYSACPSN